MAVNLRHAAAVAAIGWYLMVPVKDQTGLANWQIVHPYDTATECSKALSQMHARAAKQLEEQDRAYQQYFEKWRKQHPVDCHDSGMDCQFDELLNSPPQSEQEKWDAAFKRAWQFSLSQCIASDDPRLKEK